ncbi:hypothetical protein ACWCQL_33500 [Streptomyces sp. NPDC002073]
MRLRGPLDNFDFRREESYLFIAGGIGITPILTMARQAAAWGPPWKLPVAAPPPRWRSPTS